MKSVSKTVVLSIVVCVFAMNYTLAALPGGSLDPTSVPKYQTQLVIPPAMPKTSTCVRDIDYYEIGLRQFQQQILPPGFPSTKVWGYGSVKHNGTFNYPAYTIEAKNNKPVRVKWINELKDAQGNFLPHLLPIDQTLHWANPPGGEMGRDMHGMDPTPYTGPVPMVVHLHGAHVTEESDGYPEAWVLPAASNIPAGYATEGTLYDEYKAAAEAKYGQTWTPGSMVLQYRNDQRATALWFHDHSLGMTRANVYAGPAGFYIIRGGSSDTVCGRLPSPAPMPGDCSGKKYYEIPLIIQDKSFNNDGSMFFPDNRAFFEGLDVSQLQIPFIPDIACNDQMSDISPIWNPEFFGNTMMVNGGTWPSLNVEKRRYRFRILNACNSRFLMLQMSNNMPIWQIGTEGGFLPSPVKLGRLLVGPAERADVIVDFSKIPVGTTITMLNVGPDEPFGGGEPGVDFEPSDPQTTGQVMQFVVVPRTGYDISTPPDKLGLPKVTPITTSNKTNVRKLSLNELSSETVLVPTDENGDFIFDENGNLVLDCVNGQPFGPMRAALGIFDDMGMPMPMMWMDAVTENPKLNSTEIWEIHNFTMDAHPIHVHLVMFQVVSRQPMEPPMGTGGPLRNPEVWETGFKDTVIAYPGEITRIKAKFDIAGLFVWHCHILDHEDNEMMRPYRVVP